MAHPLLPVLLDAADGTFAPVDGAVEVVPGLSRGRQAVLSCTGHAWIATHRDPAEWADLPLDGYGSALAPALLQRLAGPTSVVGVLDVTLAARGRGGEVLPARPDLDGHPRVRYAHALRDDVRVFGDERGLVTLAAGLAGRRELSVELTGEDRPRGTGRCLLRDALTLVPPDEPVFAAVSPGNARSLRAFLAAGFVPLGSEVLLSPAG